MKTLAKVDLKAIKGGQTPWVGQDSTYTHPYNCYGIYVDGFPMGEVCEG